MKISEALGAEKPLAVEFDSGAILNITYKPPAYTIAEIEAAQEAANKDPKRIIEMVQTLVTSWDLTDDDGVLVSLASFEVLRTKVPSPVFGGIMRAIREDQNPSGEA